MKATERPFEHRACLSSKNSRSDDLALTCGSYCGEAAKLVTFLVCTPCGIKEQHIIHATTSPGLHAAINLDENSVNHITFVSSEEELHSR